jgi:hypothetical protein
MIFQDFYVGQRIQVENRPFDTGTITQVMSQEHTVRVSWDSALNQFKSFCKLPATFKQWLPLDQQNIVVTKQDKINLRIRKLWNESNWVKMNPSQAY